MSCARRIRAARLATWMLGGGGSRARVYASSSTSLPLSLVRLRGEGPPPLAPPWPLLPSPSVKDWPEGLRV